MQDGIFRGLRILDFTRVMAGAPLLGEHNDYVFGEPLGLGKEEIACLKEDGGIS